MLDFFIIGAQRCGTTSLRTYLCNNGRIAMPLREVDYYCLNYDKGAKWYASKLPKKATCIGEKCANYLACPDAPGRIRKDSPNAKFIALLRNPVDRALSHYVWARSMRFEHREFDDALKAMGERDDGWFGYLSRGYYAQQLKHWFRFFDTNKVHVVISEEFFADPARTLRAASKFLNVEFRPPNWYTQHGVVGHKGVLTLAKRAQLAKHFRPHNRDLEQLLGRHVDWNK